MDRIVVAVDGSPEAQAALEFGAELAVQEEAELVIVHVLSVLEPVERDVGRPGPHRVLTVEDDDILREAAAVAEGKGAVIRREAVLGIPAEEIVALADEADADMIVIGSRGQGRMKSALLGSTSREVAASSKRPVLIIK